MKIRFLVCIILCAIVFCSCTANPQESDETPTVTPSSTPLATPTPAPTPETKPEIADVDRQSMLSDLKAYMDTVKFNGDIITVTYVEDVSLSGRYYAKYNVFREKEGLEYCSVTTDFYIDLITKEIKAGTCLMPGEDYLKLTNKLKLFSPRTSKQDGTLCLTA